MVCRLRELILQVSTILPTNKMDNYKTCPAICIDSITCDRGFLPTLLGCGATLMEIPESATPRTDSIERPDYT